MNTHPAYCRKGLLFALCACFLFLSFACTAKIATPTETPVPTATTTLTPTTAPSPTPTESLYCFTTSDSTSKIKFSTSIPSGALDGTHRWENKVTILVYDITPHLLNITVGSQTLNAPEGYEIIAISGRFASGNKSEIQEWLNDSYPRIDVGLGSSSRLKAYTMNSDTCEFNWFFMVRKTDTGLNLVINKKMFYLGY